MEELETSVEMQEVAEPETSQVEEPTQTEPVVEQAETEEVAKPQQTPEENAAFARMRREQEQARREAEAYRKQAERMAQAVSKFGYQGNPDDIADQIEASATGKPVDQIRAERLQREQAMTSAQQAAAERDLYKQQLIEFQVKTAMEQDLKKIRSIDKSVKKLDDLGPEFASLVNSGVDAETAYFAVKAKEQAYIKPKPKDIGAIGAGTKEKDYYTPDEVDRLTDEEMNDPKIRAKVRKSMTKWK